MFAMRSIPRLALAACLAAGTTVALAGVDGQGGETAYNAAEESFFAGEAQRLEQISRQLQLNQQMLYWSGYGPLVPGVFEPWPRVPGDIWGYPSPSPIQQPIGYQSIQTRRNRWIYRPIYARDLPPGQLKSAPAEVESPTPSNLLPAPNAVPELPAPSDAPRSNAAPADGPLLRGLRNF